MTQPGRARWAPQKKDVLSALSNEILHNYGKGRTIIAIDGVDVAGTSAFADDLAGAMRVAGQTVFRASIQGFHRPRVDRYARGRDSPEGYYRDSYDYLTFRRTLVEPFRMGGSAGFVPAAFDVRRDAKVEPTWLTGPADAVLIVDGVFLNRPELRGLWNYSIWLDVPDALAEERRVDRDRDAPEPRPERNARYTGAHALYVAESQPRTTATAIIDNSDIEHPRRVFADSC
ncbi:MAG: uridine kinase [Microbacteriaceae bacterium]|jgi:uridine kinase|nr:uridine kinase [Microbacteriaceae bacterium]